MPDLVNTPVDSLEGITILMQWARVCGYVLDEAHEKIAIKYGVSTEGVTFRRPMPVFKGSIWKKDR